MRVADAIEYAPTVRGAVMIAKTLKIRKGVVSADNPVFRQTCVDILSSETSRLGSREHHVKAAEQILQLIEKHCPARSNVAEPHAVEVRESFVEQSHVEEPVAEMAAMAE